MTFEQFDQYHEQLDPTEIGYLAVNADTDEITGLDGSIVVCSEIPALKSWCQAHGIEGIMEYETVTYSELMGNLCWEGVSCHLDTEAAQRFMSTLAKDLRFRPEVLAVESDGWTMVTSCFDPYKDSPSILRRELEAFDPGTHIFAGSGVRRRASATKSLPAALARCRKASMAAWQELLEELEK